jgi:hypothetical protein
MNSPNAGWLIYPPIVNSNKEITGYETTPTLFLPKVKYRVSNSGNFSYSGYGNYWSSTMYVNNGNYYSEMLRITYASGGSYATFSNSNRSSGFSVRCVAESRIPAN